MTTELIEIDSEALALFLDKKNLARQEFALKLGISTKTIQRWLNGSVRRVRPETLGRMAHVLETTPDQLRKSSIPLELRPINRALEEICRDSFLSRIRATDEYASYLKLLKAFNPQELCSAQRMTLYMHIGFTSFFLGKIRASRLYLDEALKTAQSLNNPGKIVSTLTWSALREQTSGSSDLALSMIEEAESYLPYIQDLPRTHAEFLFRKGYVLYHRENFEDAIPLLRESILIEHKQPALNFFLLGMRYFHLSECYLRTRNFPKARAALLRTGRIAEKAGWVRGQCYSNYSVGIIDIFQNKDCQSVRSSFNKARTLRSCTPAERINIKPEQREFIYLLIKGQLNDARNLIMSSIRLNRRYAHFFACSVLDGLFLQKFAPHAFSLRRSLIDRATNHFEKNNMQNSLTALRELQSREKITLPELLELYVF